MSIKRQLTEHESRIHAAGMAAARRGETHPSQQLPPKDYYIWMTGWRRVGRKVFNRLGGRSSDGNTLAQGVHIVRTEVDNLDDALKIIDAKQRAAKSKTTRKGRPPSLEQEIHLSKMRSTVDKNRKNRDLVLADHFISISELERRAVERVLASITMLTTSVNEMSNIAAVHQFYPKVNRLSMIKVIEKLSFLINNPMPDFTATARPAQTGRLRCFGCGAELKPGDGQYCIHCSPPDENIKIASEARRTRTIVLKVLESEVKLLKELITSTEEAICHAEEESHSSPNSADPPDVSHHIGHQEKDTPCLETGGRKENLSVGGSSSNGVGAHGTRNAEG